MRSAVLFLAIAGLSSAAIAQTGSLSIVGVGPGDTIDTTGGAAAFTISVYGDADFGTAIAGGGYSLLADANLWSGSVTDMSVAVPDWAALGFQDDGHAGDGNYNGVIFGQLIFPPFIPADPASMLANGPVLISTFTVTVAQGTAGVIDWTIGGGVGPFIMEIFTDDGGTGSFTQLTEAELNLGGISVLIFPTPSSLALLGLGGLVAGRRRR